MKLGFTQVYNEVNWIGFAIDQAMKLCDKLLIIEGSQFVAFPDIPERSTDGTLDIISDKVKQYSDRIICLNTTREHENYRHNQCANFNQGLQFCDIGDYFLILDADDFFTDNWIVSAGELMQRDEVDIVYVRSYNFIFGFNWRADFGKESPRPVIVKKIQKLRFYPTHRIKNYGPHSHSDNRIARYHYKWLKPKERMSTRMKTSGFYHGMVEWFNEYWDKIELEKGREYPYLKGKFKLHKYEGEHPSILDNHPWRYIEDIRKI